MGLFKEFKDMKDMVEAAPGMMESANTAAANAQAQAAAYQAQAAQMQGNPQAYVNNLGTQMHGEPTAEALEPISGVTLETYTAIIKAVGSQGTDQAVLDQAAVAHGVKPADWAKAKEGWGARLKADRALGAKFNTLYTAP
jgi:hypothetical protein